MTVFAPIHGLIGGVLIGAAAVLLMLVIGHIAGVSGIVYNALTTRDPANTSWRLAFILGLPVGACLVASAGLIELSSLSFPAAMPATIVAGFLVGVGTTLGSGCTSGHGVCGLARFSMRSLVATATFMAAAAVTVFIVRHMV
jgi:uncharacterized membrane protein YedE/YeeE